MELKRLIANDSKSALQSVKDECGGEALIVSTNKVGKKTEVIYAIDIGENVPEEDFKKPLAETARFSDALGEVKERQNNGSSDIRNLLGQIQRELGTLKQKIDSQQIGSPNPMLEAPPKASDLAYQSHKMRVEKLTKTTLEEQKSWSGIQLFTGAALSGKASCFSRLTGNTDKAFNGVKSDSYAIINLNDSEKSSGAFLQQWQHLGELAKRENAPIFNINEVNDLSCLIESFASRYNLLVDLNDATLLSDSKMIEVIKKYGVEVNCCIAANAPVSVIQGLSKIQDHIASMNCICTLDEHDEIDQIIGRLAANDLQISAINQVTSSDLI